MSQKSFRIQNPIVREVSVYQISKLTNGLTIATAEMPTWPA